MLTDEDRARLKSTRDRLRTWRESTGLSREALAKRIGCSARMLQALELADEDKLPGNEIAQALEAASGGEVPSEAWLVKPLPEQIPSKASADDDKPVERAS